MDTTTKSEEEFIADIKKSIQEATLKVSDKVVKSAFTYLVKQKCLEPSKEAAAKAFFVKKIPTVLANELTKELNVVLGLNLDIN